MTGPEPGDLARIDCCQTTVTDCCWDGLQWRSFDGHRTILPRHANRVRPLSVVPTDSLEMVIADELVRHWVRETRAGYAECACGNTQLITQHSFHVAAAVRSAITKPTTEVDPA